MPRRVIAVMGATGHIGTVLTEELLKRGHGVRALGRDRKKIGALALKGAKIRTAPFDDAAALTEAFRGADAVFAMLAPAFAEEDFASWQDRSGSAIAAALVRSGVKTVVNLSSIGAHHPEGTGPIAGLHRQEKRMEAIPGLNVIHLRPSYFMENHFGSIQIIKGMGINGSAIRGDLAIAQVATADLGRKAADLLDKLDFTGRSVVEFGGPRELTMVEATSILGDAVGLRGLKYVHLTYEEALKGMVDSGMKAGIAGLMVELARGFNEGRVCPEGVVTDRGTTTLEIFAKGFADAYASN